MIEKIILFLAIGSFVVFIISLITIEEYVEKRNKKFYKSHFRDYTSSPRIDSTILTVRLFFSNMEDYGKKLKNNLIVYRISFLLFIIFVVVYLNMTR